MSLRHKSRFRFWIHLQNRDIVTGTGNAAMSDAASGETNETIKFYHLHKPYGNFSNFAAYAIELDGKIWPTSEHYFQAQTFVGTSHEETVRQAATPGEAATIGRDRSRPLRPDWEAVKDNVMRLV
jgi:predicted NAD-dependent protein-ADP-ribosyltransferase YbiA (DUF1768 family)